MEDLRDDEDTDTKTGALMLFHQSGLHLLPSLCLAQTPLDLGPAGKAGAAGLIPSAGAACQ